MSADRWIADRMRQIDSSGVRKVFELAKSLKNSVNLSIGQPDFDVPAPIKAAARAAIDRGDNAYTVTQGLAELRDKLLADVRRRYPHSERDLIITSGTSGGLVLAICCTVNPGDEVIVFDPYFVMYPHLIALAGGTPVYVDAYPEFHLHMDRVRAAVTPRTRALIVNSPGNPTGRVAPVEQLRELALFCRERNILLLSDEVYSAFCFDQPFHSPAEFNEDTVVFDGFSKSYAMTGWRLGFAHGPRHLMHEMAKLQQFTFVCAPSMVQHAGVAALDVDISEHVANYRKKRDCIVAGLRDRFELANPEGAFYLFAKAPHGSGTAFVEEAIRHNLLIMPGTLFSRRDTHFRLSFAADDRVLDQGIEILNRLATA